MCTGWSERATRSMVREGGREGRREGGREPVAQLAGECEEKVRIRGISIGKQSNFSLAAL